MRSASRLIVLASLITLAWVAVQLNPAQARSKIAQGSGPAKQPAVVQVSPTVQPQDATDVEPQMATLTPRPSPQPVPTPPPSNPDTTQTIIIFGVLIVVVVIFGVWLNRNRVF